MRGLDINRNKAGLVRNRCRLKLFAAGDQITDIHFFVFVTLKATVTLGECTFTAVITTFKDPFHGGLAWVEQYDFPWFYATPVDIFTT